MSATISGVTATYTAGTFTASTPDSANGGYLVSQQAPYEDTNLARIMQQAIVGVTGLPPQLIRPRFQTNPGPQPSRVTNWAAVGFTDRESTDYPAIVHDPNAYNGEGGDWLIRWETIKYLVSFYGPNSDGYATLMRDGFYIPQNWEILYEVGIKLYECKHEANVSELVNKMWLSRSDVSLTVKREIRRLYPVRNLVSFSVIVETTVDEIVQTVNVPVLQTSYEPTVEAPGGPSGIPLGIFTLSDPLGG